MKKLYIASFFLIAVFVYLWLGYTNVYHSIGKASLQSPYINSSFVIDNPTKDGSIKYVALGDSLSAGVGANDIKDTFVYLYTQHLAKTYGKVTTINLAHPGDSTVNLINYQLNDAILENPGFVTLLIGVNDIHAKKSLVIFEKNYEYILTELTTKTKAKIIVINLPYLGSDKIVWFPFNYLFDFRIRQFNDIIFKLSQKYNIKLV